MQKEEDRREKEGNRKETRGKRGGKKGVGVLGASSLFPAGGSAGVNAGDEEIGTGGGGGSGRGVCGRPRPGHRHRNTPPSPPLPFPYITTARAGGEEGWEGRGKGKEEGGKGMGGEGKGEGGSEKASRNFPRSHTSLAHCKPRKSDRCVQRLTPPPPLFLRNTIIAVENETP